MGERNLATWITVTPAEAADLPGTDLVALDRAVARVGDRWTLLLVAALLGGPRRFGELAGAVPSIAPNILTARLRQLARHGLVLATPYSRRPLRMAYELTPEGSELAGALTLLSSWGARHDGDDALARRHDACGTAVELRPWCPTCDRPVDDDETDDAAWM